MVDEYELVSHEELEFLRNELKKLREGASDPLPHFADIAHPISQPLAGSSSPDMVTPDMLQSLNSSLHRLNKVMERQYTLFERAQREAMKQPLVDENLSRLERQNEKIAAGMVGISNMIRDQQIQINQLSVLFRGIQAKLEEVRLQRRSAPGYKMPSPVSFSDRPLGSQAQAAVRPASTVKVDVPPPVGPEIIAEEKKESYPTFSMMPGPKSEDVMTMTPDDIPLPPPKKGVLQRFVNR